MNQSNVGWIEQYMEWTDTDGWKFGAGRPAHQWPRDAGGDACERFAAAYLDWMDTPELAPIPADNAIADGIDAQATVSAMLWDAFMVGLHTDADCMPSPGLRIEADDATPCTAIAA